MRVQVETKLRLSRTVVPTPLGNMLAMSSDEGLCALEFMNKRLTRLERRLERWFPAHEVVDERSATIDRTITWLRRYFDGVSAEVVDLPLDMRGGGLRAPRLEAASADSTGRNDQLRRHREGTGIRRCLPRRRPRQRRQSHCDHRSLPPRDRIDRSAHRVRRRTRPEDLVDRPRAPLEKRFAFLKMTRHEGITLPFTQGATKTRRRLSQRSSCLRGVFCKH